MALEIIGAGFGRTGTHSLKIALEHLGFGPCHHMFEIRDNPALLPDWQAASRGEKVDWDRVFSGYRAQVDWPGARYWRELAAHFPNARVILTVRDPDDWFDSAQATVVPFVAGRGTYPSAHINAIGEMGHETVMMQVFDGRITDRDYATRVFREHIAEVKATIPPGRLLVFDLRDGWSPLCEFLGLALPVIPFPHTNSSKSFKEEEWKETRPQPVRA